MTPYGIHTVAELFMVLMFECHGDVVGTPNGASAAFSRGAQMRAHSTVANERPAMFNHRNSPVERARQAARNVVSGIEVLPSPSGVAASGPAASLLGDGPTLKLASLKFDAANAIPQDGSWRQQNLLRSHSPRLLPIEARPASKSEGLAALQSKSDADIIQMLLDHDLSTATFIEYLQQHHGSPTLLIPWLQTLAALASKVGLLLESTRFLTCDLQLARILMHIQLSSKVPNDEELCPPASLNRVHSPSHHDCAACSQLESGGVPGLFTRSSRAVS